MTDRAMPARLPECFRALWKEVARADEEMHSRRRLSERLGVSTHTLQRMLIDGDVPDLTKCRSSYVRASWTRTVARMAAGLGLDPGTTLESVGIPFDAKAESIIRSEAAKWEAPGRRRPSRQVPDFAAFILALMRSMPEEGSGAGRDAREDMLRSLRRYLTATGATAPGIACASDLSSGAFCRSCMASLSDEHNRGASETYCRWCSDEEGRLREREEVHRILTNWFLHWQKGISEAEASDRAGHYMKAMPAWAGRASESPSRIG